MPITAWVRSNGPVKSCRTPAWKSKKGAMARLQSACTSAPSICFAEAALAFRFEPEFVDIAAVITLNVPKIAVRAFARPVFDAVAL